LVRDNGAEIIPLDQTESATPAMSDDSVPRAVGLAAVNALKFVLDTPQATAIIQDVGESNILLRFFGWADLPAAAPMQGPMPARPERVGIGSNADISPDTHVEKMVTGERA